ASSVPATNRSSTSWKGPSRSPDRPPAPCRSFPWKSERTASSAPRATTPSRSARGSGTRDRDRPATGPLVRRPTPRVELRPSRPEQGLPGRLVLHVGRDRPLLLRDPGADGDVPDVLL